MFINEGINPDLDSGYCGTNERKESMPTVYKIMATAVKQVICDPEIPEGIKVNVVAVVQHAARHILYPDKEPRIGSVNSLLYRMDKYNIPLKPLMVKGEYVIVPTLPDCDFCAAMNRKVKAKVDGKTTLGVWANMCARHYSTKGIALGLGKGQRLILEGSKESNGITNQDPRS